MPEKSADGVGTVPNTATAEQQIARALDLFNNLREHYCPPGTPSFTDLLTASDHIAWALAQLTLKLDKIRVIANETP